VTLSTKKTRDAIVIASSYQSRHSKAKRREVEAMEDRVRMKKGRTLTAKVGAEIRKLNLDTNFSKGKESKYTKTIAMYWHIKELLACGIDRRGLQENIVLQRLDQLDSSMTP
jgi:hypothetical protein